MNKSEELVYKRDWSRRNNQAFVQANGFSRAALRATGGLRKAVLQRDGYACVNCEMTDEQHRKIWNQPITVDHKDKDHSHNTMDNLQTLCLRCHGKKDLIARLRTPKGPPLKEQILKLRSKGMTYRDIACVVKLSLATVYRWEQIWNAGRDILCQRRKHYRRRKLPVRQTS